MRQSKPISIFPRRCLQLLVDVVGGGDLEHVLLALLGGVGDLAVVEDDGVAVGTALGVGPANALGEAGLGVGEEELEKLVRTAAVWEEGRGGVQCHHR